MEEAASLCGPDLFFFFFQVTEAQTLYRKVLSGQTTEESKNRNLNVK